MRARAEPRGPSWASAVAAAGLAVAAASACWRRLADPDLPWHLATGRLIVSARALPAGDVFSYTFPGKRVPEEYTADVVLYVVHRLLPSAGLPLLVGLALALTFVLMQARVARRPVAFDWLVLCFALLALVPWVLVRPATLGWPLLAAELLLIERHRRGGGERELWALVPLQVLWANVHGFAILGAGIVGAYAAYAACCRLARSRAGALLPAAHGRRAGLVAAVAAAAVAATCVSGFGPGIFTAPLRVSAHANYILEWMPSSFSLLFYQVPGLLLLMFAVPAALALGSDEDGGHVPDLFTVGLAVGSLALTLLRVRLAPVFVIAAAPLVARRLREVLAPWRSLPWLAALAGLMAPVGVEAHASAPLGTGFDDRWMPVSACDFVARAAPVGPVWNDLALGGYLIWRFGPERKVFIDGRTAYLYPQDFLEETLRAQLDPAAFKRLDERWGFEWALVDARPGERFAETLAKDARWAMLYADDRAAVYVRAAGPNAALARSGYRLLRHATTFRELTTAKPPLDVLASDVALALSQAPHSSRAHVWAAALAFQRRDVQGVNRELIEAGPAAGLSDLAMPDPDAPKNDKSQRHKGTK